MHESVLAVVERSGLVEEYHPGAVAVVDPSGRRLAAFGDVDRWFYIRSAAKPFQAQVAVEAGVDLPPTHLAVACSSHSADPIHVAIVADILGRHGLDPDALRCPPARPFPAADRRRAAAGDTSPARLYHNCSGKHAALLSACVVAGWDPGTYMSPEHPLQQRIGRLMAEVTDSEVGPPGVDGCGLPVWRVTVAGMAGAYARLATQDRFRTVRTAMSRYPMLVSGENRSDGLIARCTGGLAKGGAAGCMGAAWGGRGLAAKAWTGSGAVAAMGVTLGIDWMGAITPAVARGLADTAMPPVTGGGEIVGRIRPTAVLENA